MRTLGEVLADRTAGIRHSQLYRMQLALRDKEDYSNDQVEETKPRVIQHIVRHSNMGKQEFDLLQQTALGLGNLRKQVAELQIKRKPKGTSTYKGIK